MYKTPYIHYDTVTTRALHKPIMKNTKNPLAIIVLFTSCSLLHNNGSIASSLYADSFITSNDPVLLAASSTPVTNNANKAPQGNAMQNKVKPLEPVIRDAVRKLVNTSDAGLVEEKTDKGVEVKLKGRFRTAPVATIDENGDITVQDYTEPPAE